MKVVVETIYSDGRKPHMAPHEVADHDEAQGLARRVLDETVAARMVKVYLTPNDAVANRPLAVAERTGQGTLL